MFLHALYMMARQEEEIEVRRVRLADLRLRLPNGEAKIPHGGMTLLCQVNGRQGVSVGPFVMNTVGRLLLRGGVRTATGTLHASLPESGQGGIPRYTLQVAFRGVHPFPGLQQFPDAHAAEFVVTGFQPAADPGGLLLDPTTLKRLQDRLDRSERGLQDGELSTEDLVAMLGGEEMTTTARFDREGGFRFDP